MTYEPRFTVTPDLLAVIEQIAALRQRIRDASVELAWIPALQKDARTRNAHASTAIEGNPLTLPEVRALADGIEPTSQAPRSSREVVDCFAGLVFVIEHAADRLVTHETVLGLHRVLAHRVMEQGAEGEYRVIRISVGRHQPPAPEDVRALMTGLLDWWNGPAAALSPVITSAIVHHRFESIHPFGDGNGRTGRALALLELYRRRFDTDHIFAVDEWYWEDRPAYYAALDEPRDNGDDLTRWLEYSARGLLVTLERAWGRILALPLESTEHLALRPRQERLLAMLSERGSLSPAEVWEALGVSRQGAMDLINPLLHAGLVEKVGTRKTGRYRLRGL